MEIDLRENGKGCYSIVHNDILSWNSKELWCYPYIELENGETFKLGNIYVDRESSIGKRILELKHDIPKLNSYLLEVCCDYIKPIDFIWIISEISRNSYRGGKEDVRREIRRALGV